jgi:hypothetical protein
VKQPVVLFSLLPFSPSLRPAPPRQLPGKKQKAFRGTFSPSYASGIQYCMITACQCRCAGVHQRTIRPSRTKWSSNVCLNDRGFDWCTGTGLAGEKYLFSVSSLDTSYARTKPTSGYASLSAHEDTNKDAALHDVTMLLAHTASTADNLSATYWRTKAH